MTIQGRLKANHSASKVNAQSCCARAICPLQNCGTTDVAAARLRSKLLGDLAGPGTPLLNVFIDKAIYLTSCQPLRLIFAKKEIFIRLVVNAKQTIALGGIERLATRSAHGAKYIV